MATSSAKPFNVYHSGKTAFLPPKNVSGGLEITQDMHLKMSKKIAQLTKVIYALNTKNDEHDMIVETLRAEHEEETKKILAETKTKVEMYEKKMDMEINSAKRLEEMHKRSQEQEKLKVLALQEFDTFKKQAEERETQLKTEHAQKLLHYSQEVLQAKNDFQDRVTKMDEVKKNLETEKMVEINRIKEDYKKRSSTAEEKQSLLDKLEKEKETLETKYQLQVDELSKKCENLQQNNAQLTEDFEFKLKKAESFHEKELAAYKDAQHQSESEQIRILQKERDEMRKDFSLQESQYKSRIDKLLGQICNAENETKKCQNELEKLRSVLEERDKNSSLLFQQLTAIKEEASTLSSRLKEADTELARTNEQCEQQARDLLQKAKIIGEMEATSLQQESSMRDLNSKLTTTRDRLNLIETRKRALESRAGETEIQASSQIKALEQALEDLSVEKQQLKEKWDQELQDEKKARVAAVAQLNSEHSEELTTTKFDHKQQLEAEKSFSEKKLKDLQEKMLAEFVSEKEKKAKEYKASQSDLEKAKTEISIQLQQASAEIERLKALLGDKETGLGFAASEITSLKEALETTRRDLTTTKGDLTVSCNKVSAAQAEIQNLKLQHEAAMKAAADELESKLQKLTNEMDEKWKDTLRKECDKLRKEINSQKNEERKAEMSRLSQQKDEQMTAVKEGWESKFRQLLDEVSSLKSSKDQDEMAHLDEINKIRKEAENENKKLQQGILDSANEHNTTVCALQKAHETKLAQVIKERDAAIETTEENLREKHIQDMKGQLTAHKATVQMMKDKAENDKLSSLSLMQEKHKEFMESLRMELHQKHEREKNETNQAHQAQLQAAKMELERAMELARQKETDFETKKTELEENIRHRQTAIERLEEDVKCLQTGISQMAHEIEAKGKEILSVRSEANRTLRIREEQLARQHKDELDNLQSDLESEKTSMLQEFQQAQALLKDKIATLQLMLREADEKYRNRESRSEDVETIRQLQEAVRQREHALKQIMDDKKYYQMELVNRETNFNKVFSASPNVGVLNPLQAKTRPKEKASASRFNSTTSYTRLEPLPNSPVHDSSFSSARPLPPTKKFVK